LSSLRDLRGVRWLVGYYLLTPLFAAADLLGWAPVRVAGLPDLGQRIAYYLGLLGIGIAARTWPRAAPALSVGESSVNLTLLLLSVLAPVWGLMEDPAATEAVRAALPARVANLALGGTVLALSLSLTLGRWSERATVGGGGRGRSARGPARGRGR
jgi:hypothetical protein